MKPNSVDAICTDPPYGLEFMGKEWDRLTDYHGNPLMSEQKANKTELGKQRGGDDPFIAKGIRYSKDMLKMQLWHTQWLTEAYHILKPGGSMLVMGGTRTFHRLACAIEDSGFIIKDTLMWIYGSGFPKAQDLGKMIDKRAKAKRRVVGSKHRNVKPFNDETGWNPNFDYTIPSTDLTEHWDGFKVGGIKPAYEPIIWAVKPPEGSYVDNVLKWGVGAVNVDECRIGIEQREYKGSGISQQRYSNGRAGYTDGRGKDLAFTAKGRFPANVILDEEAGRMLDEEAGRMLDEEAGRMLDEQSGDRTGAFAPVKRGKRPNSVYGEYDYFGDNGKSFRADSGGASRFFYCAKASRGERNAGLEGMEEKSKPVHIRQSSGRQKAGEMESLPTKNNHPTVKPIKLFEYLIKLVTREGQVILDPFIGSGTTAIAAHNTGRKCVGIEKEDEYLEIAKGRIAYWQSRPRQLEMRRV